MRPLVLPPGVNRLIRGRRVLVPERQVSSVRLLPLPPAVSLDLSLERPDYSPAIYPGMGFLRCPLLLSAANPSAYGHGELGSVGRRLLCTGAEQHTLSPRLPSTTYLPVSTSCLLDVMPGPLATREASDTSPAALAWR